MNPKVVILSFFFDDTKSVTDLFPLVGAQFAARQWSAELVLIDDGSFEERPPQFLQPLPPGISSIEIVRLNRNGGHQLAIAIGLAYLADHYQPDIVVVMDADGEDRPEDVLRLIDACLATPKQQIVFAGRAKRSESPLFRVLYQFYKLGHLLLTGRHIRFGNFSAFRGAMLRRLVADPNLHVHYAASVVASKIPHLAVPCERGKRLHGRSKLNFVGLVAHGLAAITCYNEIVGVRLLVCTLVLASMFVLLIVAAVAVRLGTTLAIPGWATYVTCSLLLLLFQSLMLGAVFTFIAISRRTIQGPQLSSYYRALIHDTERIA